MTNFNTYCKSVIIHQIGYGFFPLSWLRQNDTASVIRELTPPWHLIIPLIFVEVRLCSASVCFCFVLFFSFGFCFWILYAIWNPMKYNPNTCVQYYFIMEKRSRIFYVVFKEAMLDIFHFAKTEKKRSIFLLVFFIFYLKWFFAVFALKLSPGTHKIYFVAAS